MATAIISNISNLKIGSIGSVNYPIINISNEKPMAEIKEILPFRIKLTNIGIGSYGPSNPAPIGIAIIGLNNYIL